jgi:hypothetical protein
VDDLHRRLLQIGFEAGPDLGLVLAGGYAVLSIGPVRALDDAVGLKMRALHERAAHRDFIDIHAASLQLTHRELELLCVRHTPQFSLGDLALRLGSLSELDDDLFGAYGLDEAAIRELRAWAVGWESDIRARLAAGEDEPISPVTDEWGAYLAEDPT